MVEETCRDLGERLAADVGARCRELDGHGDRLIEVVAVGLGAEGVRDDELASLERPPLLAERNTRAGDDPGPADAVQRATDDTLVLKPPSSR